MKKTTIIGMMALLLIAASCKKDKNGEDKGFKASIESHTGNDKTHMEGTSVKWDLRDKIMVFSSSMPEGWTFAAENVSDDGKSAGFYGEESTPQVFYQPPYVAFYPNDKVAVQGDAYSISLPSTQTFVDNTFVDGTFGRGDNPMVAVSETRDLNFKNICGILELDLQSQSACTVKKISIMTNSTNERLWGTGIVDLTNPSEPALGELTGGNNIVTLDCGDGVDISSEKSFRIVVPAGTLKSGFIIKLTDSNNKAWKRTAHGAAEGIERSKIVRLKEQNIETHEQIIPEVTLQSGCVECEFNIGGNVVMPSGTHSCEFGLIYSETDETPTIEEGSQKIVVHHLTDAPISGSENPFNADISELDENKTYYFRAYALCDEAAYSENMKTIIYSCNTKPIPASWVNGENPHPFTVGPGKIVHFSQGNLQYNASGASATAPAGQNVGGTWRFAEHQFDILGSKNTLASQTYDGWIDLFGWGTSGYNHNNENNKGNIYQPWSTESDSKLYLAYGKIEMNLSDSLAYADWGYNAISNGGNTANYGWRTLTGGENGEWDYLKTKRTNAGNLWGRCILGTECHKGLVLLPDDWTGCPAGLSFIPAQDQWNNNNQYTYEQWSLMEANGAVFIPLSGLKNNFNGSGSMVSIGTAGSYWTSTYTKPQSLPGTERYAFRMYIGAYNFSYTDEYARSYAMAVRLVKDATR